MTGKGERRARPVVWEEAQQVMGARVSGNQAEQTLSSIEPRSAHRIHPASSFAGVHQSVLRARRSSADVWRRRNGQRALSSVRGIFAVTSRRDHQVSEPRGWSDLRSRRRSGYWDEPSGCHLVLRQARASATIQALL